MGTEVAATAEVAAAHSAEVAEVAETEVAVVPSAKALPAAERQSLQRSVTELQSQVLLQPLLLHPLLKQPKRKRKIQDLRRRNGGARLQLLTTIERQMHPMASPRARNKK